MKLTLKITAISASLLVGFIGTPAAASEISYTADGYIDATHHFEAVFLWDDASQLVTSFQSVSFTDALGSYTLDSQPSHNYVGSPGDYPDSYFAAIEQYNSGINAFAGLGLDLTQTAVPQATDMSNQYTSSEGSMTYSYNGTPMTFYDASDITISATVPVPEPETYAMLAAGLGMLGFIARRKKQI